MTQHREAAASTEFNRLRTLKKKATRDRVVGGGGGERESTEAEEAAVETMETQSRKGVWGSEGESGG